MEIKTNKRNIKLGGKINMEQEIIQAIKENKLYDYVANNFYKMCKKY